MIAPATRTNLLSAQIDKAAILASYEQGLFTEAHLSVLLDDYCSLQEIARASCDEPSLRDVTEADLEAMVGGYIQSVTDQGLMLAAEEADRAVFEDGVTEEQREFCRIAMRAALKVLQNSRKDGSPPK